MSLVTTSVGTASAQVVLTRDQINADYRKELSEVYRRRAERLGALAVTQTGVAADQTYGELFNQTIAQGTYREVEAIAKRLIEVGTPNPTVDFLANVVSIMAEADRGAYDESFIGLSKFVRKSAAVPQPPGVEAKTILLLGESYSRTLLSANRADLVLKMCDLIESSGQNDEVRQIFRQKRIRVKAIGTLATPFEGADLDGKPINLAEFRGQTVLVLFWASWCASNEAEAPRLRRIIQQLGPKGPVVIGINLDAVGKSKDEALAVARRFVLDQDETWRSIADGEAIAEAYGIKDIPANVLIGPDGKIARIDVTSEELAKAVALLTPSK